TPGYKDPTDDDPVTQVNWDDARQFCKWLGETDGRTYRLPTLAEALWAARAGNAGVAPGATVKVNDDVRLEEYAWTERNSPAKPGRPGPGGYVPGPPNSVPTTRSPPPAAGDLRGPDDEHSPHVRIPDPGPRPKPAADGPSPRRAGVSRHAVHLHRHQHQRLR